MQNGKKARELRPFFREQQTRDREGPDGSRARRGMGPAGVTQSHTEDILSLGYFIASGKSTEGELDSVARWLA